MLDSVDRDILNCLQEDARMKYSDIAKRIGKPISTVFERIKRLEESGVIKQYVTILNPDKVEKGLIAYLLGQAQLGEKVDLDEVGKRLASIPEVQELHFITGEWDFLLKMRVKDEKEYYRVVKNIAKSLITRGKGMMVPKTFKEEFTYKL